VTGEAARLEVRGEVRARLGVLGLERRAIDGMALEAVGVGTMDVVDTVPHRGGDAEQADHQQRYEGVPPPPGSAPETPPADVHAAFPCIIDRAAVPGQTSVVGVMRLTGPGDRAPSQERRDVPCAFTMTPSTTYDSTCRTRISRRCSA